MGDGRKRGSSRVNIRTSIGGKETQKETLKGREKKGTMEDAFIVYREEKAGKKGENPERKWRGKAVQAGNLAMEEFAEAKMQEEEGRINIRSTSHIGIITQRRKGGTDRGVWYLVYQHQLKSGGRGYYISPVND